MTKAIIIDDEHGARESLANILEKYFEDIEVMGKAESAESGEKLIRELEPDLVFLDIEMPKGNAFDLLDRFEETDFNIIFVTAYDQYAIRAIKFSALDYILKPVDIDELSAAIQKMNEQKEQSTGMADRFRLLMANLQGEPKGKRVAIPDTEGLTFIELRDIVRCASDGNYTEIHLKNGKMIVASRTLAEYDELFSQDNFYRVHRSHLINLEHLSKYIRGEGGTAVMSDGSEVEVSRRKKADFMATLNSQ